MPRSRDDERNHLLNAGVDWIEGMQDGGGYHYKAGGGEYTMAASDATRIAVSLLAHMFDKPEADVRYLIGHRR